MSRQSDSLSDKASAAAQKAVEERIRTKALLKAEKLKHEDHVPIYFAQNLTALALCACDLTGQTAAASVEISETSEAASESIVKAARHLALATRALRKGLQAALEECEESENED